MKSQQRILIVEDSPDIQLVLQHLFLLEGFDVSCASNGKEALEVLRSGQELPHVILLDLMMPVMDGYIFREQQIRDQALASIPVIIMTADANIAVNKKKMLANEAFKKPVDADQLIAATRRYCAS